MAVGEQRDRPKQTASGHPDARIVARAVVVSDLSVRAKAVARARPGQTWSVSGLYGLSRLRSGRSAPGR